MEAVKILEQDDDKAIIGGYGVIFGGVDLDGETFEPDTDYMLDYVPRKLVFIDHAEDTYVTDGGKRVKLKAIDEPVGEVVEVTADDVGLYMRLQIEKSNRYWPLVERMVGSGKTGLSSGTIPHMARRKGGKIVRWPIAEESFTMTPAEPRTVASVERIKAIVKANPDLEALFPEAAGTAAEEGATVEPAKATISVEEQVVEENIMSDKETNVEEPGADPLEAQVKGLGERIDQIMDLLEKAPALKSAGYTTDDGGTADPTHKSFGDFLLSVRRNDTKRLASIYKARREESDTKDQSGTSGPSGGYLVPEEYLQPLLQLTEAQSQIYSRVNRVPVSRDAGTWPALDQFVAPTAGSGATAMAASITAATTAAGAALTETQAKFANLEWRVSKIGGYVEVENELIADSPQSIEALLRMLFSVAIAAKNERNILRGSGAGEPTGILNAACTIGVTTAADNTFAYADALAMKARFKSVGGSPVWIIHPGVWPDIGVFETSAGGGVWQANQAGGMPQTLLGYPIIESEHMPQDDNDDVILADLSAYVLFERQALSVAFSEHAAFTSDKGTWRFTARNDGMPWLKSAITLADPQGSYTVSPFVYHND